MKRFSYLTASILVLSLIVLGCSQDAPTASSEDGVVLQPNVREAETADAAVGIPSDHNCCPPGFGLFSGAGASRLDLNGDDKICILFGDPRDPNLITPIVDNGFPCDVSP